MAASTKSPATNFWLKKIDDELVARFDSKLDLRHVEVDLVIRASIAGHLAHIDEVLTEYHAMLTQQSGLAEVLKDAPVGVVAHEPTPWQRQLERLRAEQGTCPGCHHRVLECTSEKLGCVRKHGESVEDFLRRIAGEEG